MRTLHEIEIDLFVLMKKALMLKSEMDDIKALKYHSITDKQWYKDLTKLAEVVCELSGITIYELKGKDKSRPIADARKMYYRRAKETTTYSLANIGFIVNKKHDTVLTGIKESMRIPELIKQYDDYFSPKKVNIKDLVPGGQKFVVIPKVRKSRFAEITPANEQEYSGFRTHQL